MARTVTVRSGSDDGSRYEITLEATGADRGRIRLRTWTNGRDPAADPPDKDEETSLKDIRAAADHLTIFCRGEVFGPDPTVTCAVHPAEAPNKPFVRVEIRGTLFSIGDGIKDYVLDPADVATLTQFIAEAGFPALPD
jgi:hypothetical protein